MSEQDEGCDRPASDCEPSSCSDSEQDDCGCGSEDDDCDNDCGPQGPQGPPGPSAPMFAQNPTFSNYARFYGLTTDDKKAQVLAHGNAVAFPNQTTIIGTAIQAVSQTEILLKQPGSYLIRFGVTTLQAGQLQLEMGHNYDIKRSRHDTQYVPLVSSTATNQNCVSGGLMIAGEDMVRVEKGNDVIRLVNPASNVGSVLQIAGSNAPTLKQPRVHWISVQKCD